MRVRAAVYKSVLGILLTAAALRLLLTRNEIRNISALESYNVRTLHGDSAQFGDAHSRVTLLNVWATWCVPCMREAPQLQRIHERFKARGLLVIGVSIDAGAGDELVRQFANSFRLTYELWLDPEQKVMSTLGVVGVPSTFLIDAKGRTRWRRDGVWEADDAGFLRALTTALEDADHSVH